jgi:hypothetical protein
MILTYKLALITLDCNLYEKCLWCAVYSNIPIQKLEQNDEVRQQENLTVSQLR